MKKEKEQKLIDILENVALTKGFELVDVEFSASGHSGIIRVFLDKQDGLNLDDIVSANKWVDEVVENNEPFVGSYTLEVSSPGIDRPLRTAEHFTRFAGEEVRISSAKIDGRANWSGTLRGLDSEDVLVESDEKIHRIPMSLIKKAYIKGRL